MIKFVGDVCFTDGYFDLGFGIGSLIEKGFNPLKNIPKNDDLWIGNFEGVASSVSDNSGDAAKYFRINPDCLCGVVALFDFLGVANNHIMQHGETAYSQTLSMLDANAIRYFGDKKIKSREFQHLGKLFTITGFSIRIDQFSQQPLYWHNPEIEDVKKELNLLSSNAFKIAYIHWGYEFINRPFALQKLFAHALIDMGFDLIIGMHPHVLQGFEVYKSKYIYYSLGNFLFDMPWDRTRYGAIVNLDVVNDQIKLSHEYIKIGDDFAPTVVLEKNVPAEYRFSVLNNVLEKEDNGEQYFSEVSNWYGRYRKSNHVDIIHKMLRHPSIAMGIISDFVKRRIIK